MKRILIPACVLVAVSFYACGGGGGTTDSDTSTVAKGATTTTDAATSSGQGKAVARPCGLLSHRDVSRAFGGGRAPSGRAEGSGCVYRAGRREVRIGTNPAPGGQRAAAKEPVPLGGRRVTGPGFVGVARTYIKAAPKTGAQAGVNLVAGSTSIQIVLTDRAKTKGSLIAPSVRLARAAARRLHAGADRVDARRHR